MIRVGMNMMLSSQSKFQPRTCRDSRRTARVGKAGARAGAVAAAEAEAEAEVAAAAAEAEAEAPTSRWRMRMMLGLRPESRTCGSAWAKRGTRSRTA